MQFERSDKNVGGRVLKGAGLLVLGRLLVRSLSLINIAILGRLLSADDFGVIALAMVVVGLLTAMSDMKVAAAVIALDDIDNRHIDTGFTIQLLRGIIVALIMFAAAQPVAIYMETPELVVVLRVLAIAFLLEGLNNPAFILFQRNVDFSKEVGRQAIASIVAGAALIGSAFYFQNYWAIVIGTLVQYATNLLLTYWRVPYRPRLSLSKWRDFLGFSGWMTLQTIARRLTYEAPPIMIGKILGTTTLGFFVIARDTASLTMTELMMPLRRTLMPGFGAIKHDQARLSRTFLDAQEIMAGISLPVGFGLALLSQELLSIMVGTKWLASSPAMQLLAISATIGMLTVAANGLVVAMGHTRLLFFRTLATSVFAICAIWYGIGERGMIGAVYGIFAASLFTAFANMTMVYRFIHVGIWRQMKRIWRSVLSAAVMCAAVLMARPPFDAEAEFVTLLLRGGGLAALGAFAYIGTHTLLWHIARKPDGFEANLLHYGGRALTAGKARFARASD